MSDVKRYNNDLRNFCCGHMVSVLDGEFVLATDYDALASRLAEAERRVEIYATERDRQAKRAELMCDELVAIVSAILPDKISVDGVTYEYVPPDPHLHLKLLTKAINAARERVAAECAALSPRHQSAEGAEGEGQ